MTEETSSTTLCIRCKNMRQNEDFIKSTPKGDKILKSCAKCRERYRDYKLRTKITDAPKSEETPN
jgi:NAD-dependent SIR2 family protein deacetylase